MPIVDVYACWPPPPSRHCARFDVIFECLFDCSRNAKARKKSRSGLVIELRALSAHDLTLAISKGNRKGIHLAQVPVESVDPHGVFDTGVQHYSSKGHSFSSLPFFRRIRICIYTVGGCVTMANFQFLQVGTRSLEFIYDPYEVPSTVRGEMPNCVVMQVYPSAPALRKWR